MTEQNTFKRYDSPEQYDYTVGFKRLAARYIKHD